MCPFTSYIKSVFQSVLVFSWWGCILWRGHPASNCDMCHFTLHPVLRTIHPASAVVESPFCQCSRAQITNWWPSLSCRKSPSPSPHCTLQTSIFGGRRQLATASVPVLWYKAVSATCGQSVHVHLQPSWKCEMWGKLFVVCRLVCAIFLASLQQLIGPLLWGLVITPWPWSQWYDCSCCEQMVGSARDYI